MNTMKLFIYIEHSNHDMNLIICNLLDITHMKICSFTFIFLQTANENKIFILLVNKKQNSGTI